MHTPLWEPRRLGRQGDDKEVKILRARYHCGND